MMKLRLEGAVLEFLLLQYLLGLISPSLFASSRSQPVKCGDLLLLDLFCNLLPVLLSNMSGVLIELRLVVELFLLSLDLLLVFKQLAHVLQPVEVENVELLLHLAYVIGPQTESVLFIVEANVVWVFILLLTLGLTKAVLLSPAYALVILMHSEDDHDHHLHIIQSDLLPLFSSQQFP